MGLAFAMSILLAIPNPSKIRMALRAHRQKPVPVSEQTLLASKTKADKRPSAKPSEPPAEQVTEPLPTLAKQESAEPHRSEPLQEPAKRPIQVASSNPSASLEMTAPELPAAVPAPVTKELGTIPPLEIAAVPQPVPAPVPPELNANPVVPSGPPVLTIPVPDPIQQTSRSLTTAPAFPLDVEEPAIIGPASVGLSNSNTAAAVSQHGADVRPGNTPKTWTFHFNKTPLPIVLRLLGDQAGSSILVEPEIDGTFTGEFFDADPAQVLAMVVKAHRFSVSRRGGYLLIGIRDDAGARGRSQR